jgi:hypothetical protein
LRPRSRRCRGRGFWFFGLAGGRALPHPRCHPGLEPGSILRSHHNRKGDGPSPFLPSPTHRTALGLDLRAALGLAQAVNGPRIKSEDGMVSEKIWTSIYPSSPSTGAYGGTWHKLIHLIPLPKTSRILLPSPRAAACRRTVAA